MRIVAGQFKGRKLLSPPPGSETRPITGMAKESLFAMLAGRCDGASVLDVYCGTGTLGIEALSRGAARCCFVERDAKVLQRLRRNIRAVDAEDRCQVRRGDAARQLPGWLNAMGWRIDLAFVDPPYAQSRRWSWDEVARQTFTPLADHLAVDGVVVLRTPAKVDPPDRLGPLMVVRRRTYGDMLVALLQKTHAGQEDGQA